MMSNRKFTRPGVSIQLHQHPCCPDRYDCGRQERHPTSDNDVWFVGYTPYYTAGIWGGCDNNQKLSTEA